MNQYFPKPYESFGGDIQVKVDLSSYAAIIEIKIISHANTSSFSSKTNLASLKTEFAKLDTGKLTTVPADLSNLSDVVKMRLFRKWYMIN